jgi:hypothetical protein
MAGRDTNRDIGISNQTLDKSQAEEQIQDPALADVGEDEEDCSYITYTYHAAGDCSGSSQDKK